MTEAEWLKATDPLPLLTFLQADWESSRRELQLFVCATLRRFWPVLGELGLQFALEVTERDADGEVGFRETQQVAEATWAFVHRLPNSTPGYAVGLAAAWATCGRGNRHFAEHMVRDLLALRGTWAPIKSLVGRLGFGTLRVEQLHHVRLLHDIFGNPFRPVTLNLSWLTSTVHALATGIYEEKAFDRMPILADALQDAGCDNEDILNHCRSEGSHCRGCWCLDLVLGKT